MKSALVCILTEYFPKEMFGHKRMHRPRPFAVPVHKGLWCSFSNIYGDPGIYTLCCDVIMTKACVLRSGSLSVRITFRHRTSFKLSILIAWIYNKPCRVQKHRLEVMGNFWSGFSYSDHFACVKIYHVQIITWDTDAVIWAYID